jgi:16S rRNA G966 N2-methylase RsmD
MTRNFNAAISALETSGISFHLIFLDPPYGRDLLENALDRLGHSSILETEAIVVAESSSRESTGDRYGRLILWDKRVYGDTALSFYINSEKGAS